MLFLSLSWVSRNTKNLTLLAMNNISPRKSRFSDSFATSRMHSGKSPSSTVMSEGQESRRPRGMQLWVRMGFLGGRACTLEHRVDTVHQKKQPQSVQSQSPQRKQQQFLEERPWVPYSYRLASPLFSVTCCGLDWRFQRSSRTGPALNFNVDETVRPWP